uniref:ATP synthase F0 subunit 8 n=1 Tax=Stenamma muralla TaxID=1504015 RepID=UPI001FCCD99F|nr:ATP synthase F0 subunit 8 [Stenamma muralla]UNZ99587.1 ATP synthase F0 subunit 8 [Stenamma muralla]
MPQMKPIMWLFMLNYTIMMLFIVSSFMYFFYPMLPPLSNTFPSLSTPKPKWNWKW